MSSPFARFFFRSHHRCATLLVPLIATGIVHAGVVTFEGFEYPELENTSWQYTPQGEPARWIADGWLFQEVEVCCGGPPGGDNDRYLLSLAHFAGEDHFFIEWRMFSNGDSSEIEGVAPASMVAGGFFGIVYHFTISRDVVRFVRDTFVVIVYVEIEPDVPHTYRLELHGTDEYVVFIDGVVIDSGVPGGAFPTDVNDVVAWRAAAWYQDSSSQWDYVRLGTIPASASGDFNSDSRVDADDFYFFHECMTTPSGSWPGCAWADMDQDVDTDCEDLTLFQAAWTEAADPPSVPQCDCSTDITTDGTTDAFDLAQLLGAWGPNAKHPADFNSDELVNAFDLALLLGDWGPCE